VVGSADEQFGVVLTHAGDIFNDERTGEDKALSFVNALFTNNAGDEVHASGLEETIDFFHGHWNTPLLLLLPLGNISGDSGCCIVVDVIVGEQLRSTGESDDVRIRGRTTIVIVFCNDRV
jgi:hypothetical protein